MEPKLLAIAAGCVLVFSVVVGVFLYYQIKATVVPKMTYAKDTHKPVTMSQRTVINDEKVSLGKSFTLSCWGYVEKTPTQHVSLLQIGKSTIKDDPTFVKQKGSNLCIVLTSRGTADVSFPCVVGTKGTCSPVTITIPYIPQERWFQLTVTYNSDTSTAIVYLDGDKVKSVTDKVLSVPTTSEIIVSAKTIPAQFEGFVASVGVSDTVFTDNDIRAEYNKGPIHTMSGLPYGLRAPFYKR
jgi:hypothetical protein